MLGVGLRLVVKDEGLRIQGLGYRASGLGVRFWHVGCGPESHVKGRRVV